MELKLKKTVAKYLGLFIDNKLNWKAHIQHVLTKLSRGNKMISKIRYYVNNQCLLNLFYSFVHSHINNNILNWTSTFIEPINRKVKASIRLISFENKYEHTKELFLKHDVLPFQEND